MRKRYYRILAVMLSVSIITPAAIPVKVSAEEVQEETVVPLQEEEKEEDSEEGTMTAQIGDVQYATLEEAILASGENDEIVLLKDAEIGAAISITKNLTLRSAEGKNITLKRASSYKGNLFQITGGKRLNLGKAGETGSLTVDGGARWAVEAVDESNPSQMTVVEAESPAQEGAYNNGMESDSALIRVMSGSLYIFEKTSLQNNDNVHASTGGGAIYTSAGGGSRIHVYGTIRKNRSDTGGAALCSNGFLDIYDSANISGNQAAKNGGAIENYSGGIITVRGGTMQENRASGKGGALWTDGSTTISGGNFTGNHATQGGAVFASGSASNRTAYFSGGTFSGNTADIGKDIAKFSQYAEFKGSLQAEEIWIPSGQFLKITGTLSGKLGVSYAGDPGEGITIAQGSGYVLKADDATKIVSSQSAFETRWKDDHVELVYLPVQITKQPQYIEEVGIGQEAVITVEARSLQGTDIRYQWYRTNGPSEDGERIDGATGASLTVDTAEAGTTYYYCILQAEKATEARTETVSIRVVDEKTAEKPAIISQPKDEQFRLQEKVTMKIEAEVKDGGVLSYQWYKAEDGEGNGAVPVEGATESSYTWDAKEPGVSYYFCRVTNTKEGVDNPENSTDSRVVKVEVQEAAVLLNGTPYSTLNDAIPYTEDGGILEILQDVSLDSKITVKEGAELEVRGASGKQPVIALSDNLTEEAFAVTGGTLKLERIVLDGGAKWTGEIQEYLQRGVQNTGRTANKPMITVAGGTVRLAEQAVLQNQASTNTAAGITMSRGNLVIEGGILQDLYGGSHGGAVYANSGSCTIRMTGGKITRVQAKNSSAAICADLNTTLAISGGEIVNNYTAGRAGGVFINGNLTLSCDARIAHNYAGGNGGGILQTAGTLSVEGGILEQNTARENGGAIASLSGTIQFTGGTIQENTSEQGKGNEVYLESQVTVAKAENLDQIREIYSARTYEITLDGNGADLDESDSEQTVHYLGKYALPEVKRNGYAFLGWYTEKDGGTKVENGDWIRIQKNTTLYAQWELTATGEIVIEEQPEGGVFDIESEQRIAMQASLDGSQDSISYQWYQCENIQGEKPVLLDGMIQSEIVLPREIGTYYYFCKVTNPNAADVISNVIRVDMISKDNAFTPEFQLHPQDEEVYVDEEAVFSVEASTPDQGTITYQWYESEDDTADPKTDQLLEQETGKELRVTHQKGHTAFYYAVATNTITDSNGEKQKARAVSKPARMISHNRLKAKDLEASDLYLTSNYWDTYRIDMRESLDGFVASIVSQHGNSISREPEKVLDGNWDTFWYTKSPAVDIDPPNRLDMTFDQPVKLDRIVYSTERGRSDGYPTKLTIYIQNGSEEWKEVGIAETAATADYKLFSLPETVEATALRFEYTEQNAPAKASEIILLRPEESVMTGSASISGTAYSGETLKVSTTVTAGPEKEDLSYQWQQSDDGIQFENIPGAEEKTYTITEETEDKILRVVIRDGKGNYDGQIISDKYLGKFNVTLKGNNAIGSTLTASAGYTDENAEKIYRWEKSTDGEVYQPIEGAEAEKYKIVSSDANCYIRAAVKVKKSDGTFTEFVCSDAAKIDVTAIMTGTPQAGSTLTASLSGTEEKDKAWVYRWELSDTPDGEFAEAENGSGDTYTLQEKDTGRYVRVRVTIPETEKTFLSEAWKIQEKDTYLEYKGDSIYLSDLRKSDLKEQSVGFGNLMFDKNISGSMISVLTEGETSYFKKGIGAHATAHLLYDVSDYVKYYRYDRFLAWLGVDRSAQSNGNGVRFTVMTSKDGQEWEVAAQTGVLKGDTDAVKVEIELRDVTYLRIDISDNGNQASDHSVIADAKLVNRQYRDQTEDNLFFETVEEYDAKLKEYKENHEGESYASLMEMEEYRMLLYQRNFVKDIGYAKLKSYLYDEAYIETLSWLMNDFEAMELYMGGGKPDGSYDNFIEVLTRLYTNQKSDVEEGKHTTLYKKMMLTTALTHSAKITYWVDTKEVSDPLRRYQIYKKLYEQGLLITNVFENLTIEEMRWIMANTGSDEEIEWLNYYIREHTKIKDIPDDQINVTNFTPGPYYFITYTLTFDYMKEKYHSEANRAIWEQKYYLNNTYAADERYDINVQYGENKPRLWTVFEDGAACGGISKTGLNMINAFGVPGGTVLQPAHLAYLQYSLKDPSSGADGIGIYTIGNNISGWTQSQKNERMLCGWGNQSWVSNWQASYALLGQAALNDESDYFRSQELLKLVDTYEGEIDTQIALCEEALNVMDLNMDAWLKLIDLYEASGRSETEFVQLGARIADALKCYPLPMWDILEKRIKANLSSVSKLAEITSLQQSTLQAALKVTEQETAQPDVTKVMANYLLGNRDNAIASFSFDGDHAGVIRLTEAYANSDNELLYRLDGENSVWKSAGVTNEIQLSDEEMERITAENDIHVKLQGTDNYYVIDITQQQQRTGLYNNDNENRITGDIRNLEWREEGETEWASLTEETLFSGKKTIQIRTKASGLASASTVQTFSFTENQNPDEKKYIPLKEITYVGCSSEDSSKKGDAVNVLDGNPFTIWYTKLSAGDNERSITVSFEDARYLTAVNYIPRQSGTSGRFQSCEIYTSMDGENWMLSGSDSGWANDKETKTIELFTPVYTRYVKVVGAKTVDGYGSAAMLEFFEDQTVDKKNISSIELQSLPSRTEYMVGDELELGGLSILAHYDDGTNGIVNPQLFDFSKTVFDEVKEETIIVRYRMDEKVNPLEFKVRVSENTKTAERIFVSELPEKTRYFVNEKLDLTGMLVKAQYTDGSEGYLFENQYQVSPTILEEDGKEVSVTVSHETRDGTIMKTSFPVEVTKEAESLTIYQNPEKMQYALGENLESKGMEVAVVYTDQTTEILDAEDYEIHSDGFSNTSGTKTLEIVYRRKPELKTAIDVIVYPYLSSGYLQLEAEEGKTQAVVTGVSGEIPSDGEVVVPSVVTAEASKNLKFIVKTIAPEAFAGQEEIRTIVLPETIQSIGKDAFKNCNNIKELYLTEHTDLSQLTVDENAFCSDTGVIEGVIYVASEELARQLEDRQLKGLENFRIRSITESIVELKVKSPKKTEYHLGEEVNLDGLTVTATLSDGSERELSENLYEIVTIDTMHAGTQEVEVKVIGTEYSSSFTVSVTPASPVIHTEPKGGVYDSTELPDPLQVKASIPDKGSLSYQWYVNDKKSAEGAVKLEGMTSDRLDIPSMEGEKYYFAVLTNNDVYGREETAVSVMTEIVKISFGSYEARIGDEAYATVEEAVEAAGAGDVVELTKDLTRGKALEIGKDITLNGRAFSLIRNESYTDGPLLTVKSGTVKLEQIILDGKAEWTGEIDPNLGRGRTNAGIRSTDALVSIESGGVSIQDGTVLRNNDNRNSDYNYAAGAVRIVKGEFVLDGGQIVDNYSASHGGAVVAKTNSAPQVKVQRGIVSGNETTGMGGAFCMDHKSGIVVGKMNADLSAVRIEKNRAGRNGGAIWINSGSAILQSGTLNANEAKGSGSGIYTGSKLTINGKLMMEDEIYLPANIFIQIEGDLSGIGETGSAIPVRVASYNPAGAKFAQAQTEQQAKAAEKAFVVLGGDLSVYADGKELYYGKKARIQITKDLPKEQVIVAGKPYELQVEASVDSEKEENIVYTWYRCNDENGSGAEMLDTSQGAEGNTLQLGSCSEGIYYFYCEVSVDSQNADPVRTTVIKVSVSSFVPAYKAIEKMKKLIVNG